MLRVWVYYLSLTVAAMLVPRFIDAKNLDSALQTLNQPAVPTPAYPVSLNENLTTHYAEEIRQISQAWNESPQKRSASLKTVLRKTKNTFFQDRVHALNAPLTQWIQQAAIAAIDHRGTSVRVLKKVVHHPVASIEKTYLRKRAGEIGYCFGRALLVHHELLAAGVPQGDIVKIFALGELSVEKQLWNFHVAVGVRDPKEGILVVDPLFAEVRGIGQWMNEIEAYDIKAPFSRTRFYPTDPRKFLPAFGAYHKDQLTDPILSTYFQALLETL
jgi:hypothetical protein